MIIYNVPRTTGKTRDDYNRQIYEAGTPKQSGWLTDSELEAKFPPPAPIPPTLAEVRATKLAEVLSAYQAAFAPIEAVYPAAEREGWPVQEAEAKALLVDAQVETPVLSLLVQIRGRGEAPAELAGKVLQNAVQWRMVYAFLTGQQQKMYAEVAALATAEAVQAYRVSYQLPEGM